MWHAVSSLLESWSSIYSDSSSIRTIVGFAHIGGLVVGGGAAIAEDRAILAVGRTDAGAQQQQLRRFSGVHRVVLAGLAMTTVSGGLQVASDPDTFLASRVFWIKMACVLALLLNGWLMTRTVRTIAGAGPGRWAVMRHAATRSLLLWLVTTLLGVALLND